MSIGLRVADLGARYQKLAFSVYEEGIGLDILKLRLAMRSGRVDTGVAGADEIHNYKRHRLMCHGPSGLDGPLLAARFGTS
jgi:hypothetical protein